MVLNATARWATGLSKRTRTPALMEAAGMMTVREEIKVATAVMTWKVVHLANTARLRERIEVTADYEMQRNRLMFSEDCLRWRAARQGEEAGGG